MNKSEYCSMYKLEANYWWYKSLHQLTLSYIKPLAKRPSTLVFDAGCGTGRMLELCDKYVQAYGLDFSEQAVDFAKSRGVENVSTGDLNTYQFKSQTYSSIISLDVLYHEGIEDDVHVLKQFYNALKPGGLLILNLPAFESLRRSHDLVVHTKRRYRKSDFLKELRQLGFQIERASYRMPLLYLLIRIKKLFRLQNDTIQSDLQELPVWINNLLYGMGTIENQLIKAGIRLPFGSSLFVVARK